MPVAGQSTFWGELGENRKDVTIRQRIGGQFAQRCSEGDLARGRLSGGDLRAGLRHGRDQAIDSAYPAEENMRQSIKAYLTALTKHQDLTSVLLLEYRSLEPSYLKRHIKERDRFEMLWRKIIESGVKEQVFACDDPAMAARALLGVMNWTVTWYRNDGPLTAGEIADQISDLYLQGLTARPGDGSRSARSE